MAVISSQPNNNHRLFNQGRRSLFGVCLSLIISLGLIIADHYHYQYVDRIRSGFSLFVTPLQYIVDYPVRILVWVRTVATTQKTLLDENNQLRYKQTLLEAQLQKLLVIDNENTQLKELLSASATSRMRVMAANILAVDTTSSRQLVVLNKGQRDGLTVGQPVLDAKGLMGQIIDVGLMTSTVLLISDSKSAVPVRDERTGERAILVGTNNINELALINLPKTTSITKGDLLVTSGLGRRYPEGYAVGRVEDVKNIAGEEFIKVGVTPAALLSRNRLVLVVWPEAEEVALTAQIDERMDIVEANS